MLRHNNRNRSFLMVALCATALILITRLPTLSHNLYLHPDEHVFYLGANSLLTSILHPGTPFEECMEYPEGSYYFYAAFQLLGKVFCTLTGREMDLQIWGRIASVFYYIAAVLLGMRLVHRHLGKSTTSLVFYSLTMCFSLFFIEFSRYGTGDMISLMLLMLLLNLTAHATASGRPVLWWACAFFVSGILGAVKYPLLLFSLVPLAAFLCQPAPRPQKARRLVLFLLACVCGLMLFSPKAMLDPAYFLRAIFREGTSYTAERVSHEPGGWLNHLLCMVVYSLFYSDIPLISPLVLALFASGCIRFFKSRNTRTDADPTDLLFYVILPIAALFFLGYNVFVYLQFFRTYTPFYGTVTLYAALAAEKLFSRKGFWKTGIVLLSGFMVLRGCFLVYALSDQQRDLEKFSRQIAAAVGSSWSETYVTCDFATYPSVILESGIPVQASYDLQPVLDKNGGQLVIQPGQLVLTGARAYHHGQRYLLPVDEQAHATIEQWHEFKNANQEYKIAQCYPDYYYYLFGGWVRGGTLSQYEFPANYVYYRES